MFDLLSRLVSSEQNVRRNVLLGALRGMDAAFIHYREMVRQYRPENIVVSFGDAPSRYVLSAHYDSIPGSTGANDNAASVCILLEMVRAYSTAPPKVPLDIVFFDLEEMFMQGSQAYLARMKTEQIKGIINFDMCGVGDVILASASCEGALRNAVIVVENTNIHPLKMIPTLPPSDDMIFEHAGIPAVSVCVVPEHDVAVMIESAPIIHQQGVPNALPTVFDTMHNRQRDSIEVIEIEAMQKTLNFAFDLVKMLETMDK
jgi:aminopeptidase YwaD